MFKFGSNITELQFNTCKKIVNNVNNHIKEGNSAYFNGRQIVGQLSIQYERLSGKDIPYIEDSIGTLILTFWYNGTWPKCDSNYIKHIASKIILGEPTEAVVGTNYLAIDALLELN